MSARVQRRRARGVQLELPPPKTWGGKRAGAGRKGSTGRRNVNRRRRAQHAQAHPVHVVLRALFSSLRSPFVFPTIERALARATHMRADFRIVHFSVQADHLHLIIEANNKQALTRGMQGLAIRIARSVNRLLFRRGKFWADRYFSRPLTSPRAVRHAVSYVLNNHRKHGELGSEGTDPCSSASYAQSTASRVVHEPRAVSPAQTWLASVGWQRRRGDTKVPLASETSTGTKPAQRYDAQADQQVLPFD